VHPGLSPSKSGGGNGRVRSIPTALTKEVCAFGVKWLPIQTTTAPTEFPNFSTREELLADCRFQMRIESPSTATKIPKTALQFKGFVGFLPQFNCVRRHNLPVGHGIAGLDLPQEGFGPLKNPGELIPGNLIRVRHIAAPMRADKYRAIGQRQRVDVLDKAGPKRVLCRVLLDIRGVFIPNTINPAY
jgi:hypothetical protein